MKCLNEFVQSAVNAPRQGDESPNSSTVAKTIKLLAISSYGYQIMECSRYSVTSFWKDKKTHAATNHKIFKRLGPIKDQLFEVGLAKIDIEYN